MPSRRIVGVDPGLQVTGYAVLEIGAAGAVIGEAGVVRSGVGSEPADLARRVKVLFDGLGEVLDQWQPAAVVIEQLYAHYAHPRTAILMGHARGTFLLAAAQRNIPVVSYAATRVKKVVTGSGRASKEQMQHAIAKELRLAKLPEPHDVADALAIALCHYFIGSDGLRRPAGYAVTGINAAALLGTDPDVIDPDPAEDASP